MSVSVNQLEKKQEKFEKMHSAPPAKRARFDYSDDEDHSLSDEGECEESDEEILDQLDHLLNQGQGAPKPQDGQWLAQLAQDLVSEDLRPPHHPTIS